MLKIQGFFTLLDEMKMEDVGKHLMFEMGKACRSWIRDKGGDQCWVEVDTGPLKTCCAESWSKEILHRELENSQMSTCK